MVYGILWKYTELLKLFSLSQNNILSASSQRPIVIYSAKVYFFNLTTLIKDADWSTATTDVPPPHNMWYIELF